MPLEQETWCQEIENNKRYFRTFNSLWILYHKLPIQNELWKVNMQANKVFFQCLFFIEIKKQYEGNKIIFSHKVLKRRTS
jgi:hypothetical protein